MAAMRLRELQTWTEIARKRNMIVVAGEQGDSKDMGVLLGMIREMFPTTKKLIRTHFGHCERRAN
jgi:hypothetical protein